MNIRYRSLLPHESKNYRSIRLESLEKFPESFGSNYQEALKIEKFRMESDIENQNRDRFMTGAFSDDELIGICAFVKEEDHAGKVYQMYVKEGFQGKNVGYGLILALIKEVHFRFGNIEITLEVTDKNDKAFNLYKKAGFKEILSTGNNTQKNDTNIVMEYITDHSSKKL